MIEREHPHLSVRRQSELLGADRGRVCRKPQGLSEGDLALMRWMDEIGLEDPTAGARRCQARGAPRGLKGDSLSIRKATPPAKADDVAIVTPAAGPEPFIDGLNLRSRTHACAQT